MLEQYHEEGCKCCGGFGTQVNKDGIKILCSTCNGTGKRWVSNMDNLPPGVYCSTNKG